MTVAPPPARTRVKICGVTSLEIACAVAEAGADAIGLVFHPDSPRFIEPARAWEIVRAAPPMLTTVGLTVDAAFETFEGIELECPTDYSQLHGRESERLVRECGSRIIKAIRFDPGSIRDALALWSAVEEVDAILVDGSAGGAGEAFDWRALANARDAATKPLILAGGLTPENVGEAVRVVRPYAVDVSSGVEDAPGRKSHSLIHRFCQAVFETDTALRRESAS